MKRNTYFSLFVISMTLLIAVVGCSNRPVEVENPTPTVIAQVKPGIVPTSEQGTNAPQNLPAPELTSTAMVSATPSTTPTPTPCPIPPGWAAYVVRPGDTLFSLARPYGITAEELQNINCLPSADTIKAGQTIYVPYLFPTVTPGRVSVVQPRPQPTVPSVPEVPNLKEEAFFNPGGEKVEDCVTLVPSEPLTITVSEQATDSYNMCVYGFPMNDQVTVELYAPDSQLVASREFPVEVEINGQTVITVPLWTPVGMPRGTWFVRAQSASVQVNNQPFAIKPFTEPAINTLPEDKVNPFDSHKCDSYAHGQRVIVRGTGYSPNQNYRLGIFQPTGESDPQKGFTLKLVHEPIISTDDHGDFSVTFLVEESDLAGQYLVTVATKSDVGTILGAEANNDCYTVK